MQASCRRHVYQHALKGYAAPMSAAKAASIAAKPNVRFVEPDGIATISATQTPATWGLDRIDQRNLPLSNSYTYDVTGAGVKAYILDTGMRLTHVDYGGRAISGYDFIDNDPNASDCHGHGTHVGGTVGSTTYGVAKGVTLVAVRVLNCQGSGSYSQIISGVDWVTGEPPRRSACRREHEPGRRLQPRRSTPPSPNSIADGVRVRRRRRKQQRERVQLLAGQHAERAHCRRHELLPTPARRSRTSALPRRVCAGRQHHVDGQQLRHVLPGRVERHVDGLAARGGCGRAVPPGQPVGHFVAGELRDRRTTRRPARSQTPAPARRTGCSTRSSARLAATAASAASSATTSSATATSSATSTSATAASSAGRALDHELHADERLPGTFVYVNGTGFTDVQSVKFNGTNAIFVFVFDSTRILARVPAGATTGKISVTTGAGTATSATQLHGHVGLQ